jgi:hypothetical protein
MFCEINIKFYNSAAEQFMTASSNKVLKRLQEISDETGWNNATDISESVNAVLKFPNKVYFSDMAYFVVQIQPPSSKGIGKHTSTKLH